MTLPFISRRAAWALMLVSALLVVGCLAVPMVVIRPFVPQDAHQLAFALAVRRAGPWVSAGCVLLAAFALVRGWRGLSGVGKAGCALLFAVTLAGAWLTRVNIFEIMFKPYGQAAFEAASAAQVDGDDKVLAVTIGGEAHAYPIRTMGYHHIVNDEVGGQPIAVTYCTLCHTGLVWSRRLDGAGVLTFRLAGINNGNALLRDEQTSSIWQQSTGEAIFGPLKGRQLAVVHSDELTFALWRSEQRGGVVLRPEAQYAAEYDPKDWEAHVERTRTVVDTAKSGIGPHELMLGIHLDGVARAYPVKAVLAAGLVEEEIGNRKVVLVAGPDHASIRTFVFVEGYAPGPSFVPSPGPDGEVMRDLNFGTAWNFQGCVISGKYAGQCLTPIDSHKDYWFDWLNHNPGTTVFKG